MKKNTLVLLLATLVFIACNHPEQDKGYTLNIHFKPSFTGNVRLLARERGAWKLIDSTTVENNQASFSGSLSSPQMYYLKLQGDNAYQPVFMENSQINLQLNPDSVGEGKITGSSVQAEYDEFLQKDREYTKLLQGAWTAYKTAQENRDSIKMSQAEALYDSTEQREKIFVLNYCKQHPAQFSTPYILYRNLYKFKLNDLEPVVSLLSPQVIASKYGKDLMQHVEKLRSVQTGKPAPEIALADTNGKIFKLSGLKGKYVLIDFWASWCNPCRAENPNVVAAYRKYHKDGFDILGVSLDKNKDRWIEAIHEDGLSWHHVSDLQGWNNAAARKYAINSIPSNLLIDPEGIIIGKNLRGEKLQKTLANLFDTK